MGNITIIETLREVVFKHNGDLYKYQFIANSSMGLGYLYKSGKLVYDPYSKNNLPEFVEIYESIRKLSTNKN